MAVHSPLNAFSFDISLIEIGQEIKLLEHLKKNLDHPVSLIQITDQLFPSNLTFCVVCFYCAD
jgi:hypothetical protein